MNKLREKVDALNNLIIQFQFEKALDLFYNKDIVSVENEMPPTVGLEAYKASGKRFIENITNQSAMLLNVLVSDDMTVVEWHFKFDHKEWGAWDKVQVSVQRWKDGKVIHERHHYR